MDAPVYLVREILEYSDGTRKIVNFKPLPMSDDEQKVGEAVAPEAPAEAVAEAPAEAPAEEAAPSAESPAGEPESA